MDLHLFRDHSHRRYNPLLREWVDDPSARPQDLDALASADEQAWAAQREEYLRYG